MHATGVAFMIEMIGDITVLTTSNLWQSAANKIPAETPKKSPAKTLKNAVKIKLKNSPEEMILYSDVRVSLTLGRIMLWSVIFDEISQNNKNKIEEKTIIATLIYGRINLSFIIEFVVRKLSANEIEADSTVEITENSLHFRTVNICYGVTEICE